MLFLFTFSPQRLDDNVFLYSPFILPLRKYIFLKLLSLIYSIGAVEFGYYFVFVSILDCFYLHQVNFPITDELFWFLISCEAVHVPKIPCK